MNGGYTKLFSEIVTSTIWQESNDCRVLWITMLALKDETQVCRATVPALAKLCNISNQECEKFLEKFQAPDKYSRSQDFEGRRIEQVDGGWLILNGQKYRDMLRGQERRDYIRQKVAEHRARTASSKQPVNKCKQGNQCKPIAEAEAETETKREGSGGSLSPSVEAERPSLKEWSEYCQRIGLADMAYAKDKFLAAEADNWSRKDNWRAYAARCKTWWESERKSKRLDYAP